MMRSLLISGGAGFIGSNLVHYWCDRYPADRLIILDALTYASNRQNLATLEGQNQIQLIQGNICDRDLVQKTLQEFAIDTVIHLAAESHVDRSIASPEIFIQTNVVGTFTLLEAFREHWQNTTENQNFRFLHVSTDEVYGSLAEGCPSFTETTAFAPNSPYSASKAGADHLARSYFSTYKCPVIITRCSNNYGPYQYPEKLIPLIINNIRQGQPLPIYGDGRNIRDWLYVEDHCRAIDCIIQNGQIGNAYNIGGNNEIRNLDLVQMICTLMDELTPNLPVYPSQKLITFVTDRPGHDWHYAIDSRKLQTELGWAAQETIVTGLRKTVEWYLAH
jgi:dTDP-glucose 4,6-dehydratase